MTTKLERRLRRAFDPAELIRVCETEDLDGIVAGVPRYETRSKSFYHYLDRGSDVLAIAHLDSVCDVRDTVMVRDKQGNQAVLSGVLDDRLGLWAILFLDKLGIRCDWLFTTDEEIGQSTAKDFTRDFVVDGVPTKQYHWLISFDRGVITGHNDVVMYDYETNFLCDLVERSGARVGKGSLSDICYMEELRAKGFNWGIGYRDYHGPNGYAWMDDVFSQLARFVRFYWANKDMALAHTPVPAWPAWNYGGGLVTVRKARYKDRRENDDLEAWLRSRQHFNGPALPQVVHPAPTAVAIARGREMWGEDVVVDSVYGVYPVMCPFCPGNKTLQGFCPECREDWSEFGGTVIA